MMVWALRALFILAGAAVGYAIGKDTGHEFFWIVSGMGICGVVVLAEWFVSSSPISVIASVVFGYLLGMLLAVVVQKMIILVSDAFGTPQVYGGPHLTLGLMLVFTYLCIAYLYRSRAQFRFLIPYVEFRRAEKGGRPVLLDTSVIVDGRIVEILQTRIIDGPVIVPQTVLRELHQIADSDQKLKRERGRLGLRVLNELREDPKLDVRIQKLVSEHDKPVDEQLLEVAKELNARVITNDFNLNRLGALEGVEIINLNELANALKPIALPDEKLSVKLIKRGEQPGQAIGYLEDGTMVVVEDATHVLGEEAEILVTNTITRETGRMIFGKLSSSQRAQLRSKESK